MRRYVNIAVVVIMITAGIAPEIESGTDESGLSLARQLDGLPLEARIAYLKYLISKGEGDAEVCFQLAISFHGSGFVDSALTWYDMTIKKDPEHYKAFVNLGIIYDEQGRATQAERNFQTAVNLRPDDVLANSHLAFMLFQRKEYESAWDYLANALAIAPDHPQPHFYLAIFFWENRMFREALDEWENVLTLDPDSYLGKKAEENIVILQKALNASSSDGRWDPER